MLVQVGKYHKMPVELSVPLICTTHSNFRGSPYHHLFSELLSPRDEILSNWGNSGGMMWGWETFRERRGKQNSKSVKMKNNISNLSSTHVDPWLFAMNSIRYKRVPNNNPPSPGPYRPTVPYLFVYIPTFDRTTEEKQQYIEKETSHFSSLLISNPPGTHPHRVTHHHHHHPAPAAANNSWSLHKLC